MSQWPFPAVAEHTTTPRAQAILAGAIHTSAELESVIKTQAQLVEQLVNRGKNTAARQAFETVKLLAALRTPETVAAMERARGLT
jgi:ethanolamine utilization protein EutA (predicted chaperonin)